MPLSFQQCCGNFVHRVGDFRQQDDIRAARDPGVQGQPADLVPHDLHDEDAPVRGGGGVDAVDHVGRHIYRALEAEGHIGAPDIVINGFWHGNNMEPFFMEQVRRFVRAVAAENDKGVEPELFVVFLHGLDFVYAAVIRLFAHQFERLAGGAEDGAATGKDAGKSSGSITL